MTVCGMGFYLYPLSFLDEGAAFKEYVEAFGVSYVGQLGEDKQGGTEMGDKGACWRVLLWQLVTGSITDKAEKQSGKCGRCHSSQCSPVPVMPWPWHPWTPA